MEENRRFWLERQLSCARDVSRAAATLVVCSLISGCKGKETSETNKLPARPAVTVAKPDPEATAKLNLRAIGNTIRKAVLAKDPDGLASPDFFRTADERAEKLAAVKQGGSLFCEVFDSKCMEGPNARSAYEIISTARQIATNASIWKSPGDGRVYGMLSFYDATQIPVEALETNVSLCNSVSYVATWEFELVNGQWKTRTVFGVEDEGACSMSDL